MYIYICFFFFQAEDGIRDHCVTGVQTCALPIYNTVLLPSHYMADFHGYEWLIGADKALDPSKLFLVATELFGNGNSSSPSNTPEPYHGPRFPVTTIRDNVEAVRRLLTEELKITHLRAIIGFSMGAQQAFQWAVSYRNFADRIA